MKNELSMNDLRMLLRVLRNAKSEITITPKLSDNISEPDLDNMMSDYHRNLNEVLSSLSGAIYYMEKEIMEKGGIL
ncbi:MAG: hypothetical protein RSE17_02790 [Bacilli bacterium]